MSAVEELKAKGNKAFAEKKYTEAVKFYTDAIDMDEDNYTLYSNRSGSYCAAGKYNLAEADARKVVQLKPDWVRGYTRLGAALTGQDKWQDAVATYEKAHELDPGNQNISDDLQNARDRLARSQSSGRPGGSDQFNLGSIFSPQPLASLRANPQTAPLFNDPSFTTMIHDLQSNPQAAMTKYQGDPRMQLVLQALIQSLSSQYGRPPPPDSSGDDEEPPTPPPTKPAPAPEPAPAPASPAAPQAMPSARKLSGTMHFARATSRTLSAITIAQLCWTLTTLHFLISKRLFYQNLVGTRRR
jgi:stress-induced-phosphoprotein 1